MGGQRCQKECSDTTPAAFPPPPAVSQPNEGDRPREHHFPGPGVLDRALALVRFLRVECPWDRAQNAESLIPHLLEEAHEVVDAIHEGDPGALEGELGDLLLNVAFQIVVAEEGGAFDADSVYARLESKMIARHPHLFGAAEERQEWEALKAAEREDGEGVLSGLAERLDPLTKAYRIQERVAGVGFDWADHEGALAKVSEELTEVDEAIRAGDEAHLQEELGDLLFAVVNLVRLAGGHPTNALARANRKFTDRFERLERLAHERGIDVHTAGLETLDALWEEIKRH